MRKKVIWFCSMLCLIVMLSGCKIESVEEHQQSALVIDEQTAIQHSDEEQETKSEEQKADDDKEQSKHDETAKEVKSEQNVNDEKESTPYSAPSSTQEEQTQAEREPSKQYVTISIEVLTLLDRIDQLSENKRPYVPADGYILSPTKVALQEGDSVYSILARVTRSHRIHMEYQGSGSSVYIQGINQLYEFDCGNLSGWMYSVNGAYVSLGAGAKTVMDGDEIRWQYTCDSGRDLHLK